MTTPIISIGVPVYNGERYLRATLDALLAQTFTRFELIISDNASTDGTQAVCLEYAAADARVRYYREPVNIGAPRNYQRVLERATAPYFKWANADDLVDPRLLERCLDVLERHPDVALAYARTRLIDADGARLSDYYDNLHLLDRSPAQRFVQVVDRLGYVNVIYGLMRRDVLRRTRLMGLYIGADVVFVAELALYGKLYEVPEILFSRRMHAGAYAELTDPVRRLQFYDPQTTRRVATFRWRQLWEVLRHRSPKSRYVPGEAGHVGPFAAMCQLAAGSARRGAAGPGKGARRTLSARSSASVESVWRSAFGRVSRAGWGAGRLSAATRHGVGRMLLVSIGFEPRQDVLEVLRAAIRILPLVTWAIWRPFARPGESAAVLCSSSQRSRS